LEVLVLAIGRWVFRVVLALPLAMAIGYLPYRAYGPDGIGQVRRLEAELDRVEGQNKGLVTENGSLQRRISELKGNRRAIERVARDELGLVRPNDIVFLFE
jgi:cell division protein FtsB